MARNFKSVRIERAVLDMAKKAAGGKYSLCGYIELAIEEKISRDKRKSK